jgi:hypothetical protein
MQNSLKRKEKLIQSSLAMLGRVDIRLVGPKTGPGAWEVTLIEWEAEKS